MTDPPVHLLLVRHAEAEPYSASRTDPALTPRGHAQARLLADWLGKYPPDALVSSTLCRAADTALPVAERLGLPIRWDARLREVGTCWPDGRPVTGPRPRGSELPPRERPSASVFPGGESWVAFRARVRHAVGDLLAAPTAGGRVVAVCHGGVLDALLDNITGADTCGPLEVALANTATTHLEHRPAPGGSAWILHTHNHRPHLDGPDLCPWAEVAR